MSVPIDMLGRPLSIGDYVVSYNNLYEVLELPKKIRLGGDCLIKLILIKKSKTTKSVKKFSRDVCIIDKDDVLIWKLKGNK